MISWHAAERREVSDHRCNDDHVLEWQETTLTSNVMFVGSDIITQMLTTGVVV